MQKNILDNVSAQLKQLDRGGYARIYRAGGREYGDAVRALVGAILDALGLEFQTDRRVLQGSPLRADFLVGDRAVFIGDGPTTSEERSINSKGIVCVVLSRSPLMSDIFDPGVRVGGPVRPRGERLQTIFIDDPAFNFDYAHILPKTEKCSVMHGHTSAALIEVVGTTKDGMVVDFNDAKPIIKDAIASLDHKLFINSRYVTEKKGGRVGLAFETVHGRFEMKVPSATTVLMDGEATVENLARELLARIAPKMPENVAAVGVYVYEGLNKGTHLLAQVHYREAEKRRKR